MRLIDVDGVDMTGLSREEAIEAVKKAGRPVTVRLCLTDVLAVCEVDPLDQKFERAMGLNRKPKLQIELIVEVLQEEVRSLRREFLVVETLEEELREMKREREEKKHEREGFRLHSQEVTVENEGLKEALVSLRGKLEHVRKEADGLREEGNAKLDAELSRYQKEEGERLRLEKAALVGEFEEARMDYKLESESEREEMIHSIEKLELELEGLRRLEAVTLEHDFLNEGSLYLKLRQEDTTPDGKAGLIRIKSVDEVLLRSKIHPGMGLHRVGETDVRGFELDAAVQCIKDVARPVTVTFCLQDVRALCEGSDAGKLQIQAVVDALQDEVRRLRREIEVKDRVHTDLKLFIEHSQLGKGKDNLKMIQELEQLRQKFKSLTEAVVLRNRATLQKTTEVMHAVASQMGVYWEKDRKALKVIKALEEENHFLKIQTPASVTNQLPGGSPGRQVVGSSSRWYIIQFVIGALLGMAISYALSYVEESRVFLGASPNFN